MNFIVANEEENHEEVARLEQAIEDEKKNWEENYDKINKGWTRIEELEKLVQTFLHKIRQKPNYHEDLKDIRDFWRDYFKPITKVNEYGYLEEILIDDLHAILDWIKLAMQKGVKLVTFDYG